MDKAPREMAEWIVGEWRSVRGSDRMLVIAITEALKVIPAAVGDLEAELAALRARLAGIQKEMESLLELEQLGSTPEWPNVKRWVLRLLEHSNA